MCRLEDESWTGPDRVSDREEEDYFNADEDGDAQVFSQPNRSWLFDTPILLLANNTGLKRKRRPGVGAATKGYRPALKPPQMQLSSLIDYGEDEEEESTSTTLSPKEAFPSLITASASSSSLTSYHLLYLPTQGHPQNAQHRMKRKITCWRLSHEIIEVSLKLQAHQAQPQS
jgi:hypothetical protein